MSQNPVQTFPNQGINFIRSLQSLNNPETNSENPWSLLNLFYFLHFQNNCPNTVNKALVALNF